MDREDHLSRELPRRGLDKRRELGGMHLIHRLDGVVKHDARSGEAMSFACGVY
jgi:hypothetical protein